MTHESIQAPLPLQPPLPPPLFLLKRSIVRPHHSSDAASLPLVANNLNVTKYMTGLFPSPYGLPEAEFWLSIADPSKDFVIVALDNTTVMGGISLKPFTDIYHRNVGLGYRLGEAYWGQGIMSDVVREFCAWTFSTQPKLLRIQAEVIDGNDGSGKVLEKARFVLESRRRMAVVRHGVVYDELCYVLFRE